MLRVKTAPRVSLFRSVPAELGEGALWHPGRQSLFWIDILGHKVFETTLRDPAVMAQLQTRMASGAHDDD